KPPAVTGSQVIPRGVKQEKGRLRANGAALTMLMVFPKETPISKKRSEMARQTVLRACWLAAVMVALSVNRARVEAQVLNELIGGAKKESEIAFTAGPTTFGGRQAFSELQAAFNKKFGLNARINFTAGPRVPARGARITTEGQGR